MEKQPSFLMRDVTYSCGYCGYYLNLRSSDRNTSDIGLKYGKALKRGIIPFLHVDESRFMVVDTRNCLLSFPVTYLLTSLRAYRPKIKLLCRNCQMYIGYGYENSRGSSSSSSSSSSDSSLEHRVSSSKSYAVKIGALQPSDKTCAP